MQVRQRLRINWIVTAFSVAAVAIMLALAVLRVEKALSAAELTDNILTASFERLILRTDLRRTGNERSRAQLSAKHAQIGAMLHRALETFKEREDREIVTELLALHDSIGKLTQSLDVKGNPGGTRSAPLLPQMQDRFLSQLNMKIYETILLITRLQASRKAAVSSSLTFAAGGILCMLVVIGTVTLINSTTMNSIIAARIKRLREGAAVIGAGNLDHRIDLPGDDEFVELALGFNEMTGKLALSYRSLEREIEERKLAEERLQRSLREKEVLLKEVHHRVKNNLQVISSLVSLQGDAIADAAVREVLNEVTLRVRSIALVHEKLYQSTDLARVDFAEYARGLLNHLWRAYGSSAAGIALNLQMAELPLSVDIAVPCGLILNELAGNALKHAFRGRDHGEVTVSLAHAGEGRLRLEVRDDGVGIPPHLDWRQTQSLGLRLVQMLAGQLRGTVELDTTRGTAFRVSFPVPGPKNGAQHG